MLRSELQLPEELTLAEAVTKAVDELGVRADGERSLAQKVDDCLRAMGLADGDGATGSSSSPPAQAPWPQAGPQAAEVAWPQGAERRTRLAARLAARSNTGASNVEEHWSRRPQGAWPAGASSQGVSPRAGRSPRRPLGYGGEMERDGVGRGYGGDYGGNSAEERAWRRSSGQQR